MVMPFRLILLATLTFVPLVSAQACPAGETCPMMHDKVAAAPMIGPFTEAMSAMHQAMSAAPVTGNIDVDFVQGMIPHHQGAIDMAKVVLASGKDPAIRELATGIIAAQEKEIAMMRAWLEQHGVKPTLTEPVTGANPHANH